MAVAFESLSTVTFSNGSSISFTAPSGIAEGDLLIAGFGGAIDTTTPTAHPGFTQLLVTTEASDDRQFVYYKIADSNDVSGRTGVDLEASSSQYASITDATQTGLDITGDMSGEAWIKPESATDGMTIFSKWTDTGNQRAYIFRINASSNTLVFLAADTGADPTVSSSSVSYTPTIGAWVHVAFTYDASAGEVKFYVNGAQQGATQTGARTSLFDSSAPFAIGMRQSSTPIEFFDGVVDDVRVWNDIRTPSEISDNYLNELVGNESGLAGYWKLNNDYTDATANSNDLTASGSPSFATDTTFSWYWNISNPRAGIMYRFSGAKAPTVTDSETNSNASGTSFTMTGIDITPPTDNSILVAFIQTYLTASNTISNYAVANNDPTWTEGVDTYDASQNKTYASAYGTYTPANTATGNLSFSTSDTLANDKIIAQLIAIERTNETFAVSPSDTVSLTESQSYGLGFSVSDTVSLTDDNDAQRNTGWTNESKPAASVWVIENI